MARETHTIITDDIDGAKDAEEVHFALDGVDYRIDLSKKNRAALEKALKPFIEAGSRVTSRNRRSSNSKSRSSTSRRDLQEVRAWAKAQGLDVSERGRIPAKILDQFDARQN